MKKAFTLIELISVIIVLGIISLISSMLVINVIKSVKNNANKRSIDNYGKIVEIAMEEYQSRHLKYPDSIDQLEIEYTGNVIECEVRRINPDKTIYLSECKVNGKKVSDNTEDGYYHYGTLVLTDEEYVDKLGNNIELALKDYYKKNNKYPINYRLLDLPKLDKDVICNSQINTDGSIYLNNCSVNGKKVKDYTYGNILYKSYKTGNKIKYNDMNFYVIKDSDENTEFVTLLKEDALLIDEVNEYGVGHVNMYPSNGNGGLGKAHNHNGYGGMAYYSSANCNSSDKSNCKSDYENSEIRYVIDAWTSAKIKVSDLHKDELGYESRLLTIEELRNNLGYGELNDVNENVYSFSYSKDYWYWVMSEYNGSESEVYCVLFDQKISNVDVTNYGGTVRPVVTLKKTALK